MPEGTSLLFSLGLENKKLEIRFYRSEPRTDTSMQQTTAPDEPVIEATPDLEDDPLLDQEVTHPEKDTGLTQNEDLTGTDIDETGPDETMATES